MRRASYRAAVVSFPAERWADAYLNAAGADAGAGLLILKSFALAVQNKPYTISGKASAVQAVHFIDSACARLNAGTKTQGILAAEAMLSFLIARGNFSFLKKFIAAIEKGAHQRDGVLEVSLETAEEAEAQFFDELKKTLQAKSGASSIILNTAVKPELLGGFRLIIGSQRQDFSLRGSLVQLEKQLGGGIKHEL